jgi:MinD-like ATPase involved in chromosome partitioning or flagellar assembly
VNHAPTVSDGNDCYRKVQDACDRQLAVVLNCAGAIPQDESLQRLRQTQKSAIKIDSSSLVVQAFRALATQVDTWAPRQGASQSSTLNGDRSEP